MSFGKRLRWLMFLRETTQKDLADAVNVGQSTVSKWMTENRDPSISVITKVADVLETSVDYLLGRTEDPNLPGSEHFDPTSPNWLDNPNCPLLLKRLSEDPIFDDYLKNPMARSIIAGIAYNRGEPKETKGFLLKFLPYALYVEEEEAKKRGG